MSEIKQTTNLSEQLQYNSDNAATGQINASIQADGTFNVNFNVYSQSLYALNKTALQADIASFLTAVYAKAEEITPAS